MMRIITGSARGTRLLTLPGDNTRPTAERVKEAVFSMLGDRVRDARVLDLFGGSGQMGLEALSRGAKHAVLVDNSREASAVMAENARRTHLSDQAEIRVCDALFYLKTAPTAPFDLVFLDPPYAAGLLPVCLSLLAERGLLAKDAVLVCEAGNAADFFGDKADLPARFAVLRDNRYGAAYVRLLTLKE